MNFFRQLLYLGDVAFSLTIAAAAIIAILLIPAFFFYRIAKEKGYTEARYFVMPFLFSIIGYMMVIALPDKNARINYTAMAHTINASSPNQQPPVQIHMPTLSAESGNSNQLHQNIR